VRRSVFAVLAVALLIMLLSMTADSAFADGAFFAWLESKIFQPSQKALILY